MKKYRETELLILDDEFINDLAMYWYFLSLQFNSTGSSQSDQLADELIENGIRLKKYLRYGGCTYLEPRNVSVDTETFFHVWLDADGDIQVGELYTTAE